MSLLYAPTTALSLGWEIFGAQSAAAALADVSDDDAYVYSPPLAATYGTTGSVTVAYPDAAVPAGSTVRSVRIYSRIRVEGTPAATIRRRLFYDGTLIETSEVAVAATASPAWVPGPWVDGLAGRGAWTAEDLGRLSVEYTARGVAANRVRIVGAWLEVAADVLPSVIVHGPSGTVHESAPPVTWTAVDPDDDLQTGYEARVYVRPAGGWPADGLPPIGSLAAGSGIVPGTDAGWSPGILDNGETFRAFVRVRTRVAAWSEWAAGPEFTLDVAAPPPPTLTVVPDPSAGRVVLTVGWGTEPVEPEEPGIIGDATLLYTFDGGLDGWEAGWGNR
jgi:hypothetical protein